MKKLLLILPILLLTSCVSNNDIKQRREILAEKTERDIQRCLDHWMWYTRGNTSWRVDCVQNAIQLIK